jgi:hypothetical protein
MKTLGRMCIFITITEETDSINWCARCKKMLAVEEMKVKDLSWPSVAPCRRKTDAICEKNMAPVILMSTADLGGS